MRLHEVLRDYRLAQRHNPSHFYPNTFEIEIKDNRLILVAVVKRHVGKRFRIVGILKPRRR